MPERWVVLPEGADEQTQAGFSEILAVHAVLLSNGKVLYFGGSQHLYIPNPPIDNTRLWDPQTGHVEQAPSPVPPYDLFCCGHAFLADGELLVAGGTSGYPPPDLPAEEHHQHYRGSRRTALFDPRASTGTNPWRPTPDLNIDPAHTQTNLDGTPVRNPDGTVGSGGRWYPTLVALGDRHVVAFGGHPQEADDRHSNYSVEIFIPTVPPSGTWVLAGDEPDSVIQAIGRLTIPEVYPRAHLLPNGRVFLACLADGHSHSWDPYLRPPNAERGWEQIATFLSGNTSDPNSWQTTYFDNLRPNYNRSFFAWSSVLLPLLPEDGYNARVLIVGRAQPYTITLGRRNDPWPPSPTTQWEPTTQRDTSDPRLFMPSPHRPVQIPEPEPGPGRDAFRYTNHPGMRQQCFPILMPDATVLVVGGSTTHPSDWSGYFFDAVQLPEVYDPSLGRWRTISAEAHVPRVYHGVALLLPDGRVWTAGSNPWGDGQPQDRELRIEVFEPWYFDQSRPVITGVPASVRHGQSFELAIQADSVRRVALIRAGSVTHGFNFDQRYVGLQFDQIAPDRLRVSAPPDAWVAPPGYYLIFVTDTAGAPSTGKFLRISLAWEPWSDLGSKRFPAGSRVTALSLSEGATSLFVVGPDEAHGGAHKVFTKFFPDPQHPDQWSDWLILGDKTFPPEPPVAVVSTRPGSISLFMVGIEGDDRGRVLSKFFPDPQHPGQWSDWFSLGENRFPPGSPITVLSLSEGATSLYVVGSDGKVWSNFFPHDGRPEWSGWFDLGPIVFPEGSLVTAVSTRPGGTSLFVVPNEGLGRGRAWSTFFDPRS